MSKKTIIEWISFDLGIILIVLGTRGWDIGLMEKWKYIATIVLGLIFAVVGFINKKEVKK